MFGFSQISKELQQHHNVEKLDDVRVIKDRPTSMLQGPDPFHTRSNLLQGVSRGFGFLRFPSLEASKAFVERNFPMIYLYGNNSSDGDTEAAKVRIAFSRERDDRQREKADGEWVCAIVGWPFSVHH